ncbi:hypothetical protein ACN20G_31260 (plasmid) [Streptomyces sp. BI20]|uniref:hypothetical protein n=1 Tax=Streptomyces sp. BI20 TaxID=3403460 RepID=UPI003C72F34C
MNDPDRDAPVPSPAAHPTGDPAHDQADATPEPAADPLHAAELARRARVRGEMARHLDAALALLDGLPDPVEREHTARILADDLLPAATRRVKAVRTDAAVELRTRHRLKLREIAALYGLSVPRVDQITKGR